MQWLVAIPTVAGCAILGGWVWSEKLGVRALLGDPAMPLERAREEVWHALASDLGLRVDTASG